MARQQGVVRWFNAAQGYGYLSRHRGPDLFVHWSSIVDEGHKNLREGDAVEFDIIQGTQGLRADQVVAVKAQGQDDEVFFTALECGE